MVSEGESQDLNLRSLAPEPALDQWFSNLHAQQEPLEDLVEWVWIGPKSLYFQQAFQRC